MKEPSMRDRPFDKKLLQWYRREKRKFPWRTTRIPYRILMAELFLQKTQAKQVEPILRIFLKRFPTVRRLAGARLTDIQTATWSLGLPARARQIKTLSRQLTERFAGRVPRSERDLLSLSGVGPYTATAVLCFAFGARRAVVDANVIRVLARYFGIRSRRPRPRSDKWLWRVADDLVPVRNAREYNWAILDFAAKVCRSRKPLCSECPLRRTCWWFRRAKRSGGIKPATRP